MNQLEQNINTLQEKIYTVITSLTTFPDISKQFLPDKQIAINILKKKNPYITEEQCELIIGAVGAARGQASDLASQVYPLPTVNSIYEEVKNIKNEIRESVMLFVNSQIDIVQDLAKLTIKVANSIAGAAVLVAPLSFNVPAAIALILVIVDGINLLIMKAMEILKYLGPMNNLILVLPSSAFDAITAPINIFLQAMIQILDKVAAIKKLIDTLISALLAFLSPANLLSLIQSLIDQIIKKKAEREIINLAGGDTGPIEAEIKELENRKSELESNQSKPDPFGIQNTKDGKFPDSLANDFLKTLDTANIEIQAVTEIIYDLTLPDGSVILDVDPDTIEKLKGKFNVVYKD